MHWPSMKPKTRKKTASNNENEISFLIIAMRNTFFFGAGTDHK